MESAVIGVVEASRALHCHTRIAGSFPAFTHRLTAGLDTPNLRASSALRPPTASSAVWMSMPRKLTGVKINARGVLTYP